MECKGSPDLDALRFEKQSGIIAPPIKPDFQHGWFMGRKPVMCRTVVVKDSWTTATLPIREVL